MSFDVGRDAPALRAAVRLGAIAVGECGLDYHYDHSPREAQRVAFELQIELAREMKLPLVVHTRDAVDDTRTLVAQAGKSGVQGVLHCFTGPRALAEVALDAGWYLSFSGVVTFKNWTEDSLIRFAPVDRV